jgi:hypothetical protein
VKRDAWTRESNTLEVGGKPSTDAALFGGRVDADEDEIRFPDAFVDIGGEEEIASARLADNLFQTRLVDRKIKVGTIPSVDARFVEVHDGHRDMGAFQGDNSTCRATYVSKQRLSSLHEHTYALAPVPT